ncbi:unnamed protein product [Hapterophycus canaliculatus]
MCFCCLISDPPQVSKFGDGFALLVLELCRKVCFRRSASRWRC